MRVYFARIGMLVVLTAGCALAHQRGLGQEPSVDTSRGDAMIADYFEAQTRQLAEACMAEVATLQDWTSRRQEYRRQLAEMLGLDPMPQPTDLKPVITGTHQRDDFTVENLHFQSLPGLYVTGNLYLPKGLDKPAPAVLYVCGHAQVKKDGVSYGNKTHYQFHPAWFARNGYVCLSIDTVQLGEIEGLHHGTYREGMWWWNSRGYTPAGVEAYNGIRALDLLQSRPEVDPQRLGITGRSGGGAYSWWVAALDDRIKVAVPVAGITDLQNHVVDGCVEGHCDCMYMVNTYRWDYARVAALVAPRPLLIANTDKDSIFPLEGVQRIHRQVRHIYRLYGADDKLGLQISEGPHKDIQELQVAAFHWFNRFLKSEDRPVEETGRSFFEPAELRVFADGLPADEITSRIHETFVPAVDPPQPPADAASWSRERSAWLSALTSKSFRAWPDAACPLEIEQAFSLQRQGIRLTAYDFTSQRHVRLRLYVAQAAAAAPPPRLALSIEHDGSRSAMSHTLAALFGGELTGEHLESRDGLDLQEARRQLGQASWAIFAPRGHGLSRWSQDPNKQIQHRRRFMLLGQTLAGIQVWDIRRALETLASLEAHRQSELSLSAQPGIAIPALYATLFEPRVRKLELASLPATHRDAADLLNVLRIVDVPQVLAMVCEHCDVTLLGADPSDWQYARSVIERLGWSGSRLAFAPQESADSLRASAPAGGHGIQVSEDEKQIHIATPHLEAVIRKEGYVSGVAGGQFLDKKSGLRDVGFGLDIVDWIMEPGSDEAYRDQLPDEMVYEFGNLFHGNVPKRSIEGPQICTRAGRVDPEVIRGKDFVAVRMRYEYQTAAPGKKTGSVWTQTLVFPEGKRYFISSDRIDAVNDSPAMFLRLDMPGHIKHQGGDTFSEIYLSYHGRIPSKEFQTDFAPDERFHYRRNDEHIPDRFIRAYRLRDPADGSDGPWLAGMTLNAADVMEAWCHQRGYVCMIEEFGGRPIRAGESFSAAFVVGFFDSIDQMHQVYDRHRGHSALAVDQEGWKLIESGATRK